MTQALTQGPNLQESPGRLSTCCPPHGSSHDCHCPGVDADGRAGLGLRASVREAPQARPPLPVTLTKLPLFKVLLRTSMLTPVFNSVNLPSLREVLSFWKEPEGFGTGAKEGGELPQGGGRASHRVCSGHPDPRGNLPAPGASAGFPPRGVLKGCGCVHTRARVYTCVREPPVTPRSPHGDCVSGPRLPH